MLIKLLRITALITLFTSPLHAKDAVKKSGFTDRQMIQEIHFGLLFLSSTQNTPWLQDKSFSPNGAAANFSFLYTLFKILETAQPKAILEFGMGQTSKLTSQYAAAHPQTSLVVVENDPKWLNLFAPSLPQARNIRYLHNEIEMVPFNKGTTRRYAKLLENLPQQKFDLIIIDGPLGSPDFSRTNIIDLVEAGRLASAFIIIFDDCDRIGEQNTAAIVAAALKKKGIDYITKDILSNKNQRLIMSPQFSFLRTL